MEISTALWAVRLGKDLTSHFYVEKTRLVECPFSAAKVNTWEYHIICWHRVWCSFFIRVCSYVLCFIQ